MPPKKLNIKVKLPMKQIEPKNDPQIKPEIEPELKTENDPEIKPISVVSNPDFKSIIDECSYIKNCVSNKEKDQLSFSYLIDISLSQSDCIKLGHGVEKILKSYIIKANPLLTDIKKPNKKGSKEKDHLFMDEKNKIIYYAELKTNIRLDTEKDKSTIDKCIQNKKELETKYEGYQVKMFCVSCRHYSKNIIPIAVGKKYNSINDNLVGINEYLNGLNIPHKYDCEDTYKEHMNYLAKKMFKK
jgi:hypothetical protein